MRVTYPDMLGDLGDQFLAAELTLGIRRPAADRPGRLEREAAGIENPEFEFASSVERIKELMEFMAF